MTKIKTATGKEYDSDYFTEHKPSKSLYFRVVCASGEEVRNVFADSTETQTLEYNGKKYEGFTNLKYATDDGDDFWKLRLMHG